jgi:hypothetical protein
MSINRQLCKNAFTLDSIPSWICPTCKMGVLETDKKNIKVFEGSESKSYHSHPAWEPSWINGGFLGFFKCTNPKCSEIVSIIGKMNVVEGQEFNEEHERWDIVAFRELNPTQFFPPLDIFHINKDVPEKIKTAILSAFNIYWADLSSCANKIRVAAECIMDDLKVPKTYMDRRKRKGYSLHKRIEIFRRTNIEEAEHLMAIKWIGNFGSHQLENLTKDDILDGFEILELVTNKIYDKNTARIKKLSKKINKRKKPIGKSSI